MKLPVPSALPQRHQGPPAEEGPRRRPGRLDRLLARVLSTGHERWARLATFVVVAGATAFVIAQMHPGLLFLNTEDVGGDNAAHITAPYYMIHYLLPHGEIAGWDSWWFDGFPLYVFYFPLPALVVAFFNLFAPYAVAFKLVTVLGTVTLPICCYAFGRLCGFARPVPALLSAGSVVYLFNTSYTIDGGNVASTMAGEFSFSLSLSFAVLFLGTFVYALRTGRLRWLSAILFLLTVMSHVVPALFAAGMAVLLTLAFTGTRPVRRVLIPVGLAGGLLSAFWLLPFAKYVSLYSSSMNYGPVGGSLWSNVFPHTGELAVVCLALVGFGFGIWHADRVMTTLGVAAIACAAMFQWGPRGLVYNGRWLPFWFFCATLLAAYAVAELGRMTFSGLRLISWHELLTPLLGGAAAILIIAAWLGVLPFGLNISQSHRDFSDEWVEFNYEGYQQKPGWPEYQKVVDMLDKVGARYGCGRLDYEYTPNVSNYFGSTLVEMSFPLWTNGCIDSTEGVYFESASTTHFHFLDQSELSIDASNPVGGLDEGTQSAYENTSVVDGVKHLQLQGVTYFLANSPEIEEQADADPQLVRLTLPGGPIKPVKANPQYVDYNSTTQKPPSDAEWDVYLIKGGSTLVTPLHYDPVVETGLDVTSVANLGIQPDGLSGNVPLLWYQQKQYWDVPIAASGPSSWVRKPLGYLAATTVTHRVVPTTVSDVRHDKSYSWISFNVTRLGSPVEVKIPYFPNWQASGATGPYLATPNLMVVVPTSHHVRLSYGTTKIDWLGTAGTIAGIGVVVGMNVRRARRHPTRASSTCPPKPRRPAVRRESRGARRATACRSAPAGSRARRRGCSTTRTAPTRASSGGRRATARTGTAARRSRDRTGAPRARRLRIWTTPARHPAGASLAATRTGPTPRQPRNERTAGRGRVPGALDRPAGAQRGHPARLDGDQPRHRARRAGPQLRARDRGERLARRDAPAGSPARGSAARDPGADHAPRRLRRGAARRVPRRHAAPSW